MCRQENACRFHVERRREVNRAYMNAARSRAVGWGRLWLCSFLLNFEGLQPLTSVIPTPKVLSTG